jgi:hypothetical protein
MQHLIEQAKKESIYQKHLKGSLEWNSTKTIIKFAINVIKGIVTKQLWYYLSIYGVIPLHPSRKHLRNWISKN